MTQEQQRPAGPATQTAGVGVDGDAPPWPAEARYEGEWTFVLHTDDLPPAWVIRSGHIDLPGVLGTWHGEAVIRFTEHTTRFAAMAEKVRRPHRPILHLGGRLEELLPVGPRFTVEHVGADRSLRVSLDGDTLLAHGQFTYSVESEGGEPFEVDLRVSFRGEKAEGDGSAT